MSITFERGHRERCNESCKVCHREEAKRRGDPFNVPFFVNCRSWRAAFAVTKRGEFSQLSHQRDVLVRHTPHSFPNRVQFNSNATSPERRVTLVGFTSSNCSTIVFVPGLACAVTCAAGLTTLPLSQIPFTSPVRVSFAMPPLAESNCVAAKSPRLLFRFGKTVSISSFGNEPRAR